MIFIFSFEPSGFQLPPLFTNYFSSYHFTVNKDVYITKTGNEKAEFKEKQCAAKATIVSKTYANTPQLKIIGLFTPPE
jgi:hypothetical protein